ncbi:acyltransferase [Planococcus sp. SIMBA_143]
MVNLKLEDEASWHLNAMRGIAAVMVLLNHFRNIFFVTYQDIENQNIFTLFLYSFAGLGHEAVMVFFVLSGFLISNSVLKSLRNWSWQHYMINRLTRLSVVLIPALFLGLIIDLAGLYLFDYSFFPHEMAERINVEVLLGNLLYLQGFAVPVLGTNDPLWSLSYEFWYYLLFPLFMLSFSKTNGFLVKVCYLTIAVICMWFVGSRVSLYFLIWLMGFIVLITPALSVKNRLSVTVIKLITIMLFVASLGISRLGLISNGFLGDILVAFTFSVLVYVTVHLSNVYGLSAILKERYRKCAEWLSGFSYTLYLVHFPILIFLFALFSDLGMEKLQPSILNVIFGIGICVVISLIAYWISLVTENKTNRVKELIYAFINSASKTLSGVRK